MKKSLLLVLGVLVSSVAMAEGNVVEGRLGYSFGEGKLTEDVTKKVVLTGEYRREVMPNLEVGLGLDVKRADEVVTKKVNNNYAVVTRTGLPVYGVVQYNFKSDSDVVPYIKGRLGVVLGRDYQVKEVAPVATTRPAAAVANEAPVATATPVAGDTTGTGTPAPATGTETPAPATGTGTPAPATGTGTPAPATGTGTPAPATGTGTPAPATGTETPAPATGTGTPAPATGTETPAPATGTGTPAPATGTGTPAPATGTGTPAPATGTETPAPATGTGTPAPATGTGTPAPATGTGTPAPATGTGTPAPATGTGTPAPATGTGTPAPAPVANTKKEFNGNALYAGIGVGVNYKNFVVDLSYNYTTGRKLSDTDLNNIQTAGVRKEVKELVKSGTGVVTLSVGYTLGF